MTEDDVFEDAYRVMMPDLDDEFYAEVRARAASMLATQDAAGDVVDEPVPYPVFDDDFYAGVRRRATELKATGVHHAFQVDQEPVAVELAVPPVPTVASERFTTAASESPGILQGSFPRGTRVSFLLTRDMDIVPSFHCVKSLPGDAPDLAEARAAALLAAAGLNAGDLVPSAGYIRVEDRWLRRKVSAITSAIRGALPRTRFPEANRLRVWHEAAEAWERTAPETAAAGELRMNTLLGLVAVQAAFNDEVLQAATLAAQSLEADRVLLLCHHNFSDLATVNVRLVASDGDEVPVTEKVRSPGSENPLIIVDHGLAPFRGSFDIDSEHIHSGEPVTALKPVILNRVAWIVGCGAAISGAMLADAAASVATSCAAIEAGSTVVPGSEMTVSGDTVTPTP